ncbi:glycine betaine ABC transporter substrate-binding protein [Arhodomonas aquaeolei]|nr:glycine betaine ABC transporter substrate-binding protein [Arhodomonas aquaeolei]MCS4504347.1 glycine betaine ABC transporter substrate-binding protein [Arhodomonas aquaeolei]
MLRKLVTATVAAGLLALGSNAAAEITVGGKGFTEQLLLASMTTQYLKAEGYDVDKRDGMGSTVLRKAQTNGQVDLYWEYTGTSLITYNKVEEDLGPEETYERVKKLDAEKGLVWLEPSDANNTYALAMREDDAAKRGIETLSDLADAVNDGKEMTIAVNAEFYARPDGFKPMMRAYGFRVPRGDIKRMNSGLTYSALKEGEVDVALVFATDGRIPAFNFRVLDDDRNYFPSYALTPVVRKDTLEANPKLREQMNALSALLDDDTMAALNARVDVDKESIERVAEDFLKKHDLM